MRKKRISRPRLKKHHKIIGGIILACILVVASIPLIYLAKYKSLFGLNIWEMYQNLANPTVQYVKINEGMRREEVADRFAKSLGWSPDERQTFLAIHTFAYKGAHEGYYFPDTYLVSRQASPEDVSKKISENFKEEVIDKQQKLKKNIINTDTAIKIASIIQREAGSKNDMGIISGIIWNRIFKGMSLDMDATLQYAKGTEDKWWPEVVPADKKIDSPYNTYKNKGLPPGALTNPGEAAIEAALNPKPTKALFYIHDKHGTIHTAITYEQHMANIEKYY